MNRFFRCLCLWLLLPLALPVLAQEDAGSGYLPVRGTPFYLLADRQFGSHENALLRVELPADSDAQAALAAYGGMDLRLYRVKAPIAFLKAQKNLHRLSEKAQPTDEGVANTLSYLWANAWNQSRRAWRDIFSDDTRQSVTDAAPALKTRIARPRYENPPRFKPLTSSAYTLAAEFRYPLFAAQPIAPPTTQLAGSSDRFLPRNETRFHLPLGQLSPGLYLAEAFFGNWRAIAPVFVSDTAAVIKRSADSLLVWSVDRQSGKAAGDARLVWTDGQGVLASGQTDADGLITLNHTSPERTILLGEDAAGGVFVSENFYYASESTDTNLYAFTDRPLYQAGDTVHLKILSANTHPEGKAGKAEKLALQVLDPFGAPIVSREIAFDEKTGGDTAFALPDDAASGGYDLLITRQGKKYGAAFRVAEYVKPHFTITLTPDQKSFKTGEKITGEIALAYPDGRPVGNVAVDLSLRAQTLTVVGDELRYSGLFPVQIDTQMLKTDAKGRVRFLLPAVKEPSRLVLTMRATDGAAYRVRATGQILVERAALSWRLVPEAGQYALPQPGFAPVTFTLIPNPSDDAPPAAADAPLAQPASWEIVHLEDQKTTTGTLSASHPCWQASAPPSGETPVGEGRIGCAGDAATPGWRAWLKQPGSYMLSLRNAEGGIVAATPFWVAGEGLKTLPGTIELVSRQKSYAADGGLSAELLATFSTATDEALVSLEQHAVAFAARLSTGAGQGDIRLQTRRLAPNQWLLQLTLGPAAVKRLAPNFTVSVAAVHNGQMQFQNAGIVLKQPDFRLAITPDKKVALPGERVSVDLALAPPRPALLSVAVVDDMIYALQPEIAPDIEAFFHHPRRNDVRTVSSLSFITYDEAADYAKDAAWQASARHRQNARAFKTQERARRDTRDTALFLPTLATDAQGRAHFAFTMPDALSRWRITVRAAAQNDKTTHFFQRHAFVESDKPFYAKWTSPVWQRQGDSPIASLAVFNRSAGAADAEITLDVDGRHQTQKVTLARGANYLPFSLKGLTHDTEAKLAVRVDGKIVDQLETPLRVAPAGFWRAQEKHLSVPGVEPVALDLPADARNLRLRLSSGDQTDFLRIAGQLIDYPWGCAEQISSRLIPLTLIAPLLPPEAAQPLLAKIANARQRLALLAGPQAAFGWWGDGTSDNLLLSAYAWYADWQAARALHLTLPEQHWQRLLDIYRTHASKASLLERALSLWLMHEMGLPTQTLADGLQAALAEAASPKADKRHDSADMLGVPDALAMAQVLGFIVARADGIASEKPARAIETLKESHAPVARALLLLTGDTPASSVPALLAESGQATPTLARSLTLLWTRRFLRLNTALPAAYPLHEAWQADTDAFGQRYWRWTGQTPPSSLRLMQTTKATPVVLDYESATSAPSATATPTAPAARLERHLWRLEQQTGKDGKTFWQPHPTDPGQGLSADALYLDEIRLTGTAKDGLRHALLEVPLPPGGEIEPSTWGIHLIEAVADKDGKTRQSETTLDKSRAEQHPGNYGVPVETLNDGQTLTFRHLLRFSQRGTFALPAPRLWPMYAPADPATEGEKAVWQVK
ncbi:MAG: alpha-2-macroglobulin family protein [Zoogloeaceae bacterium]|nr:alpha-2-macroglobulin family protein [Zoogloeaceae bacterium]